jgi:glycogen debranching enzyme
LINNTLPNSWGSFVTKAGTFMKKSGKHALQGVNPGGYYQAIWCRDASYILRDWALSGNFAAALQELYLIWSHQIQPGREKVVYGRGSPEMKFVPQEVKDDKQKDFAGALPTTIYQAGFSEIYGQNPDIDSTALMISTTAWILNRSLKANSISSDCSMLSTTASESSADYVSGLLLKLGITDPKKAFDFLVPRMLMSVDYLSKCDIDGDGLLEQNYNEDWMDTVLRAGKIVYSQACWILALNNLSSLLITGDKQDESNRLKGLAEKAVQAVEQKLWSEEDGAYIDIQDARHTDDPYRTLTQDVSLYLVAMSENASNQNLTSKREQIASREKNSHPNLQRANRTLDVLKNRVWKKKWPLVTELDLNHTGPWVLKPYQYHNHTFWPWITGIEMLARSRFDRAEECNILLSKLTTESNLYVHTFYEWVNPITDEGKGAFPFRTGISAVRISIVDIFNNIRNRLSADG